MYVIFFLFLSAFAQESISTRESEEEQAKAFYKTATVFFEEADYHREGLFENKQLNYDGANNNGQGCLNQPAPISDGLFPFRA